MRRHEEAWQPHVSSGVMVTSSPDSPPAPLTPLIGRQGILEGLLALLRRDGVRLVTLSGPGGVGKTRLALRAAESSKPDFPDGVVVVELAALADAALVVPAIARALDVREAAGRAHLDAVAQVLGRKRVLIVLDNVEQVIDAAPDIVELLGRCPGLKVLVTSRSLLRVSGEWNLPVPPMTLPGTLAERAGDLLAVESVALFVERAMAVDANFTLDRTNGVTVAEICRRLDGLPLAIELAAARLRHLPLDALLARLELTLPLLVGGPRDQPARLQTMRDAIRWSYDLLPPEDQQLFRQLAIFGGGFRVDAAQAVIEGSDEPEVLEGIARLIDCSLVQRQAANDGQQPRFTMLETIREYGREQLTEHQELAAVQRRHAAWCLGLVERAWPSFSRRVGQEPWLNRLGREHDNIRAALRWLYHTGEAADAVRLAGGMFWFWFVRSHVGEGRVWLDRVLAMPGSDEADPVSYARALLGAGLLTHFQGDDAAATPLVRQALERARAAEFGFGQAAAALTLGIIAEDGGKYGEAGPYLDEALAVARRSGDRANEALALYHQGVMRLGLGETRLAAARCEAALAIQREIGDRWGAANSLAYLGMILGQAGAHERSAALLRECLETRRALGTPEDIANGIAHVATLAAASQEPAEAARLFGAEAALRETIGSFRKLPERDVFEQAESTAKSALGAEQFATFMAEGRQLRRDKAVAAAISFAPRSPVTPEPVEPTSPDRLTEREHEVLVQLALGKTNPAIAQELFISPGTVRTHVSSILGKLGARTRTEAADLARRRGLL